ncbi:MAG: hypothetical protein ACI31A_08630, partial [Candidatus Limisoma sp.]
VKTAVINKNGANIFRMKIIIVLAAFLVGLTVADVNNGAIWPSNVCQAATQARNDGSYSATSQFVSAEPSSSSANDKYRTFVKTKNKCRNSNCSCSGYWGYKHGNGTYEGNCQNTDGHGHTCGHGPEKHGLRKW